MAPPPAKPPAARKRTRKRKRRAAASSSESSSSDDSSSDSEIPNKVVVRVPAQGAKKAQQIHESAEESSSSSSSSDSDSDPASDAEPTRELSPKVAPETEARRPRSPTPPPTSIPPFPAGNTSTEQQKQDEQVLKDRFRRFWMTSVADAFKDDLEEIRKEPNMTTSRLAMLIDSLAAGGDVLASSHVDSDHGATEMEIVLEHTT